MTTIEFSQPRREPASLSQRFLEASIVTTGSFGLLNYFFNSESVLSALSRADMWETSAGCGVTWLILRSVSNSWLKKKNLQEDIKMFERGKLSREGLNISLEKYG
ncbi:MAG: hypothetical protein ACT4OY_04940 [Alphaproteobacteria bacterium]